MKREEIKKMLPHREPMLLVDEVELDENGIAHGVYKVRGDEWFLNGHFPGNPVVPGVILCEIMAQTCAILLGDLILGKTPYYTSISKARFKDKVRPGDVVNISASLVKHKDPFYFTTCEARVNDKCCATGELSFAVIEGR
ncbi:MAG: 3-hydroxyacyl-ACP dehydratase FabZ [Eubacteriales bacterium]